MRSLLKPEPLAEIKSRLDTLSESDRAIWGKMNPAQMLHHCQKTFEVPLGNSDLKRPNFIMRMLFKNFKKSLYDGKPWKKNLPTARQLRVSSEKNFSEEKDRLLQLMEEFHGKGYEHDWPEHPAFGNFTAEQWGQMQYKHLDHHLSQFGV